MEPRTIIGPDVRTALRMVRERFGPDAMILSNRRTAAGVEIAVMCEATDELPAVAPARVSEPLRETPGDAACGIAASVGLRDALRGAARQAFGLGEDREGFIAVSRPASRTETVARDNAAKEAAPGHSAEELAGVHDELRSMRSYLEMQLERINVDRASNGRGVSGRIWRRLSRAGVPNAVVRRIVAGIDESRGWDAAWNQVLQRLAGGIGVAGDIVQQGGVFAFVGPTGAGKTTTLCKLAVRWALERGTDGLALLSLDAARIGSGEILRSIGRLLGVECQVPDAGESLEACLRRLRSRQLVLVDTAGINRKFRRHLDQLQELGALDDCVRTLLVLPANAQLSCMQGALRDYCPARPAAVIVTKLDETQSLGEVVGVLGESALPLAYVSDGQEIPDDIRVGSAEELVAHAIMLDPEATNAVPDEARTEDAAAIDNEARIA